MRLQGQALLWSFLFCAGYLVMGCRGPGDSDASGLAGEPAPVPSLPVAVDSSRTFPKALTTAGDAHEAELVAGGSVTYILELDSGEAIFLEVEQEHADIEIEVREPSGKVLSAWDTPTHTGTAERLCAVARSRGDHRVVVTPFRAGGSFRIWLARKRPATAADRLCVSAANLFQDALADTRPRPRRLERAARLWERSGQPLLASLAWREAASKWRDVGPPQRSIECFQRGLDRAEEARDDYLRVSILNRMGLTFDDLGEFDRARKHLEEAARLARATNQARGWASALTNLGLLDHRTGKPHSAIDTLHSAVDVWRQIGDPVEIAQALQNLANAHGVLDDHERALDLLAEASRLARSAGDEGREADVRLQEGWIHFQRGRPEAALPILRWVRDSRRRRGDLTGEAAVLDRIGSVLHALDRPSAAEGAYRRSLELSLHTGNTLNAAGTLANLGCLAADTHQLEEARSRLREASQIFSDLGDPRSRSHVEYCLARTEAAGKNFAAARRHARRAMEIVDRLRHKARRDGHLHRPVGLWQKYAAFEVQLLLDAHARFPDPEYLEDVFQVADMARARTLFEQVVEDRVGIGAAPALSMHSGEKALQEELNRLGRKRLWTAPEGKAGTDMEREVRRLTAELERVRAIGRAGRLRHLANAPRPVSVSEVMELLPRNTLLLSYVLGENEGHLLVLGSDGISVHPLPSRRDLEASARSFHRALRNPLREDAQWRLIAGELGEALLPAAAVPATVDRLVIVPDGMLHYVPFSALASPRDRDHLVLEDFVVSYVPSASVLARLRERAKSPSGEGIAVFADPVFSRHDDRLTTTVPEAPRNRPEADRFARMANDVVPALPRLAHSSHEATAIARLAGDNEAWVNLGAAATRSRVREADLEGFRILHIATHAWIDEDHPELSGFMLSRFDPDGVPIPSTLHLHEIHKLRLNADLAVLSGCETALGEQVKGNGLEGLAHAFLYAGSSRVLVTLWKIDDEATALLMMEFYRQLLGLKVPPATALRRARLWLSRQPGWESPVYWAPFILQGDV